MDTFGKYAKKQPVKKTFVDYIDINVHIATVIFFQFNVHCRNMLMNMSPEVNVSVDGS